MKELLDYMESAAPISGGTQYVNEGYILRIVHMVELFKDGQMVERNASTTNHTKGQHFADGWQLSDGGTIIESGNIQMEVSPVSGDLFITTVTELPSNSYNILLPIWTEKTDRMTFFVEVTDI